MTFPLTRRYLGAACPSAPDDTFVRAVCDAQAKGDIPSRAARDLVQYEALVAGLVPSAHRPGTAPRDDEPVVLASHVGVLVFGAALPEMLAALRGQAPFRPRPARGWIVAWRDAAGALHEHVLPRETGWLLESFREPTAPSEAIEDDEDRERFRELWALGILVRSSG